MGDGFLRNYLVIYIFKKNSETLSLESIVLEFLFRWKNAKLKLRKFLKFCFFTWLYVLIYLLGRNLIIFFCYINKCLFTLEDYIKFFCNKFFDPYRQSWLVPLLHACRTKIKWEFKIHLSVTAKDFVSKWKIWTKVKMSE